LPTKSVTYEISPAILSNASRDIKGKKMAKLQLSVHSDLREEAQPLVDTLQHVADSIEGYYGYIMGCQDKMDANYNAMIWGTNHLAGLVSK
jgi:hypothetical protein